MAPDERFQWVLSLREGAGRPIVVTFDQDDPPTREQATASLGMYVAYVGGAGSGRGLVEYGSHRRGVFAEARRRIVAGKIENIG